MFASSAFAASHHPTGEYAQFNECPLNRTTITDCVYSVTSGGSFTLGKKTVPIVNAVTLQGGFEGEGSEIEFYGAENGSTLSKTPQPVPGGLLGLLNCKTQTNPIIKGLCETALENGLTGANATVELMGPTKGLTDIFLSTENLLFEEGTALGLPVRFHLENPLLGSSCYIGTSSKPVQINFTTGTDGELSGDGGTLSFNEAFTIITVEGGVLVNNSFEVPTSNGCGGILSLLVGPVIDSVVGLPAGKGSNSGTLEGKLQDAAAKPVKASE
jgi:hypothetical protein